MAEPHHCEDVCRDAGVSGASLEAAGASLEAAGASLEAAGASLEATGYSHHDVSQARRRLIVFEGVDGSGKSTQARLLAERLGAHLVCFPDRTTATGQLINAVLKGAVVVGEQAADGRDGTDERPRISPLDLWKTFTANRLEKKDEILEALKTRPVVCDRYCFSGLAYTRAAYGIDVTLADAYRADLLGVLPSPVVFWCHKVKPPVDTEIYDAEDMSRAIEREFAALFAAHPCFEVPNEVSAGGIEAVHQFVMGAISS